MGVQFNVNANKNHSIFEKNVYFNFVYETDSVY